MYQLTTDGAIIRLDDGASFGPDPGNADYREFLAWLAAGGEPLPPDLPPEAGPSLWDLITEMYASIDTTGDEALAELVAVNMAQAALLKDGLGG